MEQSISPSPSRFDSVTLPASSGTSAPTECPRCHSDDIKRSRRHPLERLFLLVLRGHVYRCRDCKRRFWVGVHWGPAIVVFLSMVVVAGVVTAMVFAHKAREEAAREIAPKPIMRTRRRPTMPGMPRGLPPLSSVPRPADDPVKAQ